MLTEPVSMSGISGVVDTAGALVASANGNRLAVQVTSWDVALHVGMGSSPVGRAPDAVVPVDSMWEPPFGMIPQQDLYLASTSGASAAYQVTEFRR